MDDQSTPLVLSAIISKPSGMTAILGSEKGLEGQLFRTSGSSAPIYYNTTDFWNQQDSLIPESGSIYIYSDYSETETESGTQKVPALKIGDGETLLSALPFMSSSGAPTRISYEIITDKPSINEKQISAGDNSLLDFGIAKAKSVDINRLF